MTNKEKKAAIYKYSYIGSKTYIAVAMICSILVLGVVIYNGYVHSLTVAWKFAFNLMFKQLSLAFAVIASIIGLEILTLENIEKENEDYSILKSLHNNDKKIKYEIALNVISVNLIIIAAMIEEWLYDLFKDDVYVSDTIVLYIFIAGFLLIIAKLIMARNRKKRYRLQTRNNC